MGIEICEGMYWRDRCARLVESLLSLWNLLTIFRYCPRIRITEKKMAQWSFLCSCLFFGPFQTSMAYRSYPWTKDSSSY